MISLIKYLFKKYWVWGLGILLFGLIVVFSIWKTNLINASIADTQRQIDEANAKLKTAYEIIDKMHDEHDAALEAANAALKERMEIYEDARERICEVEKRIGSNTDFCNQLVPDDIVRLWKEQDAARISKNNVPAAD